MFPPSEGEMYCETTISTADLATSVKGYLRAHAVSGFEELLYDHMAHITCATSNLY